MKLLRSLMEFSGIEADRLQARWVSSAEAPEFRHEIETFITTLKELGPSPLKGLKQAA